MDSQAALLIGAAVAGAALALALNGSLRPSKGGRDSGVAKDVLARLLPNEQAGTTTVAVASQATMKVEAVRAAFEALGLGSRVEVVGIGGVESGVNEQPLGLEETAAGALNRVQHAKELARKADLVVAFENGIMPVNMRPSYSRSGATAKMQDHVLAYYDLAWVVVEQVKSGRRWWSHSVGVEMQAKFVEAARRHPSGGFATTTVGSLMAEDTGCDKQDPHNALTSGLCPRALLLQNALLAALGQLMAAPAP